MTQPNFDFTTGGTDPKTWTLQALEEALNAAFATTYEDLDKTAQALIAAGAVDTPSLSTILASIDGTGAKKITIAVLRDLIRASEGDVLAGTDNQTFVTPETLAAAIDARGYDADADETASALIDAPAASDPGMSTLLTVVDGAGVKKIALSVLRDIIKASVSLARGGVNNDLFVTPAGAQAIADRMLEVFNQRYLFQNAANMKYGPNAPGLTYMRFAREYEGPLATMQGFIPDDLADSPEGPVIRLYGPGMIATRDVAPLSGGRKYKVFWRGRTVTDDLESEVEFGIAWLNRDMLVTGITTFETIAATRAPLPMSHGFVGDSAVVAQADLSAVDHYNEEAVFARPFVRQSGEERAPVLDVVQLGFVDVTDAAISSDPTADLAGRVATLEALEPLVCVAQPNGTDLDTLIAAGEYYVTSPVNAHLAASGLVGVTVREISELVLLQETWDAEGTSADRFYRTRIAGTWGAWQAIATEAHVDQQIQSLANTVAAVGLGGDVSTPTVITDDPASDATFAYTIQYLRWTSFGDVVVVLGTISFTPTYTTPGTGRVLIGPLPFPADVQGGRNTAPVVIQPAGNMEQPTGFLGTRGHIEDQDPSRIVLRMERQQVGGAEVRDIALSELTSGVEVTLTFQATYHKVAV